jgi:hypothetical protein
MCRKKSIIWNYKEDHLDVEGIGIEQLSRLSIKLIANKAINSNGPKPAYNLVRQKAEAYTGEWQVNIF